MQFTMSSLAAMLVIGFAQAQTQTCSNVPNPSPPADMHCNARGVFLNPALVNITAVNTVATVDDCITTSKAYPAAIAFSYNYTSNVCVEYGQTLTSMSWRGKRKLDTDVDYFNHNCYVQQCKNQIISTATAGDGSTTIMTSQAPPPTATPATCDKNQDMCLSAFAKHTKTATSVCAGVQTQYFPPQGFGGVCTGIWDNQVTSVCSCLFGAQLVPQTTFTSNFSSSATATASMNNTATAAPIFANTTSSSTMPIMTSMPFNTTANATSTPTFSPILGNPMNTTSSTMPIITVGPVLNQTSSTLPIFNTTAFNTTATAAALNTTTTSSATQNATVTIAGVNSTATFIISPTGVSNATSSSFNATTFATSTMPMGTAPLGTAPAGTAGTAASSGFGAQPTNATDGNFVAGKRSFRYKLRN